MSKDDDIKSKETKVLIELAGLGKVTNNVEMVQKVGNEFARRILKRADEGKKPNAITAKALHDVSSMMKPGEITKAMLDAQVAIDRLGVKAERRAKVNKAFKDEETHEQKVARYSKGTVDKIRGWLASAHREDSIKALKEALAIVQAREGAAPEPVVELEDEVAMLSDVIDVGDIATQLAVIAHDSGFKLQDLLAAIHAKVQQ